jgi:hypothetical protein
LDYCSIEPPRRIELRPSPYEGVVLSIDLTEAAHRQRDEHGDTAGRGHGGQDRSDLAGPLGGDRAGTDRAGPPPGPAANPVARRSASGEHRGMARYHVTVVSGDPSRTAAEVAADAGAEVIRKMSAAEGVAALATDEQIDALTAAGATVHRHADLAEGRAERLAEVGEGDRYAEALRRLAGR